MFLETPSNLDVSSTQQVGLLVKFQASYSILVNFQMKDKMHELPKD